MPTQPDSSGQKADSANPHAHFPRLVHLLVFYRGWGAEPGDKCTALWGAFDRANRAVKTAPTRAAESFEEGIAIAAAMDNDQSVACDFVHQLFHNAGLFYAKHGDPDRAVELY